MPPEPTATKPETITTSTKSDPGIDFKKALENIEMVQAHYMKFNGKPGHNPYTWINSTIYPLMSRYEKGDRGKDLLDKMLALTKVDPVVKSGATKSLI